MWANGDTFSLKSLIFFCYPSPLLGLPACLSFTHTHTHTPTITHCLSVLFLSSTSSSFPLPTLSYFKAPSRSLALVALSNPTGLFSVRCSILYWRSAGKSLKEHENDTALLHNSVLGDMCEHFKFVWLISLIVIVFLTLLKRSSARAHVMSNDPEGVVHMRESIPKCMAPCAAVRAPVSRLVANFCPMVFMSALSLCTLGRACMQS